MAIDTIKIFPSIGIARIGNSQDFFVGPELPGDRSPPPGGYKDSRCGVRRQAARFRLFGYENGVLKQEITLADADIKWTVELANTKGSWREFAGVDFPNQPRRNNTDNVPPGPFNITPGLRTLDGPNQKAAFNTGTFMGAEVPLGEIRTQGDGRLLVLGGFGNSNSPVNAQIVHWANNDGWHDDVSDGPVTAQVRLKNTVNWIQAAPAWVICGPPKFAPAIDNMITLYDTLYQVAVEKLGLVPPVQPSFSKDIYSLMVRAINMKWVSGVVSGAGAHGSMTTVIPPPGSSGDRSSIFGRLRDPAIDIHQPAAGDMPMIWSDSYQTSAALTKTQYKFLKQWKDNDFVNDWAGPPLPDTQITPDGLTRAALENCVGGAFYPGIETSFLTRDTYSYVEPFRLDAAQLKAGDLTKQMAVPWQTDFLDCSFDKGLLWWPAQRPDDVFPQGGGAQVPWARDIINSFEDMINYWYKLGFVVQQGNQYVETERHVVCKDCFIITDRSTFSNDQVDATLNGGASANFDDSFYVVVEGFKPSELGVTGANMTPAQLAPIAPVPAFTRPNSSNTPGMSATAQKVMLEDPNLGQVQRVTFSYRVTFTSLDAFSSETETETLTATTQGMTCTAAILLNKQPNPYMLDGATSWLSIDLRVFQITEGQQRFGLTMGNDAVGAVNFIGGLLTSFNDTSIYPDPVNHPFEKQISTDQQTSHLELSRSVNGKRVFNFAVARVRYVGKALSANDVRVFFRLFTTAATGLEYDSNSTYRRHDDGTKVVPLLGFEGGPVVTIPCLATARVDSTAVSMTTQPEDSPNKRTLTPAGPTEVQGYFGCWLDFNQTELRIPTQQFAGDGTYGANARSIQDAIRGLHQCLAAEVYFGGQPIPAGATPASNDKLSQRNLAIVESDNPGGPDSHTVVHTFELKPSRGVPIDFSVPVISTAERRTPENVRRRGGRPVGTITPDAREMALPGAHAQSPLLATAPPVTVARPRQVPDELMIRWLNLPRDTDVTIYLPSVDVNALLTYARQRYEAKRIERVDDHTFRCRLGDVTYVPIPPKQGPNIVGLITLVLPDHVKYGQFFRAVVHQVSGIGRRIIGAFQLSVPVKEGSLLLPAETRNLSVLRNIALSIPPGDRWRPVFDRYLAAVAGRVRGFGGNPDAVRPSPDGGSSPDGRPKPEPCPADSDHGNLFCLNIPWKDCCIEGEAHIKLRFRRK